MPSNSTRNSKKGVSATERRRRENQSMAAKGIATDVPNYDSDDDEDEEVVLDRADASGDDDDDEDDDDDDIDEAKAQAAAEMIDAVNLDEVSNATVNVTITEWAAAGEYDSYDEAGQPVRRKRFRPVQRVAEIAGDAPLEIQVRALKVMRQKGKLPQEEYLYKMAELVLAVWMMTEPEMTLKALVKGLGAEKIGKLFRLFFNPKSRPSKK